MTTQTNYPLSWPAGWKRTVSRQYSPFGRHTLGRVTDALLDELRRLGATGVVVSTNLRVRLDGLPMSGQRMPDDPGVAVYFKLLKRDQVLACDKWARLEDNLWAIVKHIEALRGQQRWGVGTIEQAFQGYAALPPGKPSVSDWFVILAVRPEASAAEIQEAYIRKAKTLHPDVAGGDQEAMRLLNAARDAGLERC